MAAQVIGPQKKKSGIAEVLPVAGAVAGGVLGAAGGPAGALAGAGTGASLGSVAGGFLANQDARQAAIAQRMQQTSAPQAPSPQQALDQARLALSTQPPEVQQEFGPMLLAARQKLNRGQV